MKDTWNMTPDEARKYILQNWFDGDENVNAFVCGDEEYTAMAIAVEALEATKWHYPSKGEYPQNNKWVFVYLNDETCTVGLYCSWSEIKWIDNYENEIYYRDVVAWQYIVPPKEEA